MSDKVDNRYDCHEDCQCTHDDITNKCDGNCPGDIPDWLERKNVALAYRE